MAAPTDLLCSGESATSITLPRRSASVTHLLRSSSPANIPRFVVPVVVYSIQRVRRSAYATAKRSWSQLVQELFERGESELDTASPIVGIPLIVRVLTPLLGRTIDLVFRRLPPSPVMPCVAVCLSESQCLLPPASARPCVTTPEAAGVDQRLISAVAKTSPYDFPIVPFHGWFQRHKTTVSFPRQVSDNRHRLGV